MSLPTEFIPVIGPIVAALVAGATAFLASVLTKEHKTSEFRQAWIDGLRNDVSELVAYYRLVCDIATSKVQSGTPDGEIIQFFHSLREEFSKLEITSARIQLRLNPEEHSDLINQVRALLELVGSDVLEGSKASDLRSNTLLAATQEALRKEWRRVKRGEPIYAVTKWLSLMLVVATLTSGALVLQGRLVIQYVP